MKKRLPRVRACRRCGEMFDSRMRGYTVCDSCAKDRTPRRSITDDEIAMVASNSITKFAEGVKEAGHSGICALCGKQVAKLVRDHDHSCHPHGYNMCPKCFRGWLCVSCNLGLGMFGDDPDLLIQAAWYIKAHREIRQPLSAEQRAEYVQTVFQNIARDVMYSSLRIEGTEG